MAKLSTWVLLGLICFAVSLHDIRVGAEVPSETECRPYIEKALHEMKSVDTSDGDDSQEVENPDTGPGTENNDDNNEINGGDVIQTDNTADDNLPEFENAEDTNDSEEASETNEDNDDEHSNDSNEIEKDVGKDSGEEIEEVATVDDDDENDENSEEIQKDQSTEKETSSENNEDDESTEENSYKTDNIEENEAVENFSEEDGDQSVDDSNEEKTVEVDNNNSNETENEHTDDDHEDQNISAESENKSEADKESEEIQQDDNYNEILEEPEQSENISAEHNEPEEEVEEEVAESEPKEDEQPVEEPPNVRVIRSADNEEINDNDDENIALTDDEIVEENETEMESDDQESEIDDNKYEINPVVEETENNIEVTETTDNIEVEEVPDNDNIITEDNNVEVIADTDNTTEDKTEESQVFPEDDLLMEFQVPTNLRDRSHISELLHLDNDSEQGEKAVNRVADIILKDLKRIYENAIKPLETLYKYRDLSNRHFSDPEIFSKPLVLFMGPWSGGKSTILNYLTDNEHTPNSLRTGAEPSPAYFNILMHGDEPEVLDGTQLAADWTFSGLQKFGQGLEDRLRGQKLPNKLLEKVNIVEIPGILEVRKQVSRLFPFNDACQWFIDRADIIFLVYDPSKLDVGPETEAILDQLKGREYQTRIILNKGDQVKPEELLRVQGALIWNISPLMSSAQPPVMYTTSLWSHPYETGAPVRLLQAQERAFLRDLRNAIDKRIDNKIASARRFAVRVRNHAKMVDCYLTTYYNHKTLFGNKKQIANEIIEHPQNYHIYEGLSTLTNISRYDLPDPDVYRDFFRLNSLFEFKKLSETCTYFRGCPINKLDVAIAYDLPELVGKYKKMAEAALGSVDSDNTKTKS